MCVRVDVRLTSDIGSSDLTFGWSPDAINECDIIIRQHALAPAQTQLCSSLDDDTTTKCEAILTIG
jgi:hypothetical protein